MASSGLVTLLLMLMITTNEPKVEVRVSFPLLHADDLPAMQTVTSHCNNMVYMPRHLSLTLVELTILFKDLLVLELFFGLVFIKRLHELIKVIKRLAAWHSHPKVGLQSYTQV